MDTTANRPALSPAAREATRARVFALSDTAIAVIGPDHVVVEANPALCALLAAPPEQIVGRPLIELVQPQHRSLTAAWLDRSAAGDTAPLHVESHAGDGPGRRRWFTTDGHAVAGVDGRVDAFVVTVAESTATRRLTGALADAQVDMASLVDRIPVAVVRLGAGDVVTQWNPAAAEVLGWSADEAVGAPLAAVGDGAAGIRARTLSGDPLDGARISGTTATGEVVELKVWTTPMTASSGPDAEVVALMVDVTADVELDRALQAREHRWRTLVENISDTVTVLGPDGRIVSTTGQVSPVLGYPAESWAGRSFDELMHPDDVARLAPIVQQVLDEPRTAVTTEARVRHHDGSWVDIWVHAVNLIDDPTVGGVVLTTRNISEQKQAESLVASQTAILELIAGTTPLDDVLEAIAAMVEDHDAGAQVAVALVDGRRLRPRARPGRGPGPALRAALGEVDVSPALHALSGGHGVPLLRHADDAEVSDTMRPALVAAGIETVWWAPVVPTGSNVAIAVLVAFHPDRRPPSTHALHVAEIGCTLVAVALDRQAAVTELAHREMHDALTGLPNRTLLIDRLQTALDRAQRTGTEVGVVYVDLDRFKVVNDTYGLVGGDRVLAEVADRLRRVTRPDDTIARVGADEFVIVCSRPGRLATVLAVADRLRQALAGPFSSDRSDLVITASLGLAVSGPGVDAATLLRQADAAMLRAKQRGRDRVEMFDPGMQASARDRLNLAADLRRAIERGQLEVAYQPIIHLASGEVVGAEALCRWRHPARGMVPPDEFIPIAEESGVIRAIGAWVLDTTLATLAPLIRADGSNRPRRRFEVAVNLSPRQLDEPGLIAAVAGAVAAHGWQPEDLCLELTETAITEDLDLASNALLAIRATGVRIAVDDFGTGYSSLTHLQRLPIDTIKVDQSFVRGLGEAGGRDRATIVGAVVGIATAMGLDSVAEGIETKAQLAALRDLGCLRGQGYYFTEPVAGDVLMRLVQDEVRFA